ncbi:MAG TPA: hypothetical protein VJ742_09180, partial [Nitrososphaera sp.]|nr:hypothetical protein [Nitrososphaera sp.]
ICFDLEGTFTGKKGQLIEFRHDDAIRVIAYPSLTIWLQVLVESLEAGFWNVDTGISLTDQKLTEVTENIMIDYPIVHSAGQK